jgi:hypothetical protein
MQRESLGDTPILRPLQDPEFPEARYAAYAIANFTNS